MLQGRRKVNVLKRKQTQNIVTNQQCSARMNSILCESRLRCADIPREVPERLEINSCSRCDLFATDVTDASQSQNIVVKLRKRKKHESTTTFVCVYKHHQSQKEKTTNSNSSTLAAIKVHTAKKKRKIEMEAYVLTLET